MIAKIVLALTLAMAVLAPTATIAAIDLRGQVDQLVAAQRQYTPIPKNVGPEGIKEAKSGCCSHHGGVAGCDFRDGSSAVSRRLRQPVVRMLVGRNASLPSVCRPACLRQAGANRPLPQGER